MQIEVAPQALTDQAPIIGRQGGQLAELAGELRGLAGVAGATGSPEAAAALERSLGSGRNPYPCNNALGAPSQDISLDFERSFPIDGPPAERLLPDTERIWRERGYAVEPDDSDPKVSIRNATVDGYAMALYVNRTDKKAYLGASSPCVRPPSGI
jgi:hypothetical protein